MKKFCYTIFAILIFSITGCTTSIHISTSESDSSDFTSESYSAERSSSYSGGMDDWKCYHRMTKIEEYKTFYTEFLKYNEEQYFMPIIGANGEYDYTLYHFHAKNVENGEFEQGKYGVKYSSVQKLMFSAGMKDKSGFEGSTSEESFPSITIMGQCYDISAHSFDFLKEEMRLICTTIDTEIDGSVEEYYEIRINDVLVCDFIVYWNEIENIDFYRQGFNEWVQPGGYIVGRD